MINLFSKPAIDAVEAVGNVVDELFTSDDERLDKKVVLERLKQQPALIQAQISKIEASHKSWWVAGARPSLVWVAGAGWFIELVINPLLYWFTGSEGPTMPVEQMVWLTSAVLGLYGTMRTFEKVNGRAK